MLFQLRCLDVKHFTFFSFFLFTHIFPRKKRHVFTKAVAFLHVAESQLVVCVCSRKKNKYRMKTRVAANSIQLQFNQFQT